VTLAQGWESTSVKEESFHLMGNRLKKDILSCDNILHFEFEGDLRIILRIETLIIIAKQIFSNDTRLLEIISEWDSIPNLRMKSDALKTIDALMRLSSKNLFLEWGVLFEKN
jgi:hypothetical protein